MNKPKYKIGDYLELKNTDSMIFYPNEPNKWHIEKISPDYFNGLGYVVTNGKLRLLVTDYNILRITVKHKNREKAKKLLGVK